MKRRNQRRRRNRIWLRRMVILLLLILISGSGYLIWNLRDEPSQFLATKSNNDIKVSKEINLNDISSGNVLLKDLKTNEIVAERGGDQEIYPASLTKIMTTITAIEKISDITQEIQMPVSIFSDLYYQNASVAGFEPGEKVPARDLLYGILLPSGAECCLGVAEYISGSEEEFVKEMNATAEKLGMNHTNFSNSTGLHAADHYTTLEDLAILLEYALLNDLFREIFTSSVYSTTPSEEHPDGLTFYSTVFEKISSPEVSEGKILGGKTGYTPEAGLCLASLAQINDREFILITAGAEGTNQTEPFHILDSIEIYNQLN